METTSILLAKLIGVPMLAIGLGFLFDKKHYVGVLSEFAKSAYSFFMSGVCALVLGLAIVLYHNVWVYDWTVVVTLVGWGAVLKGVVRILFPAWGMKMVGSMLKKKGLMNVLGLACLVVGVLLGYYGFLA